MKWPDTDDLVLFGSLAISATGAGLVTASTTADGFLALGVALMVFGIPSVVLTFLAAGEPE